MSDFLGSYYDSAELDGSEIDERIISQRMAILSVEQPVSVLDMDNLDSMKLPARTKEQEALERKGEDFCSGAEQRSSDEEMEIPVASMSMFDQEKPSMVSVQLQTLKGVDLQAERRIPHQIPVERKHGGIPPVSGGTFSPASTSGLGEQSRAGRFSNRTRVLEERKAATNETEIEQEECRDTTKSGEKRATNVKASLLKLFGRRQDEKKRRK